MRTQLEQRGSGAVILAGWDLADFRHVTGLYAGQPGGGGSAGKRRVSPARAGP